GLTNVLAGNSERMVGVWAGMSLTLLAGADLVPVRSVGILGGGGLVAVLLPPGPEERFPTVLWGDDGSFYSVSHWNGLQNRVPPGWPPGPPRGSTLRAPTLATMRAGGQRLHLAGVDSSGIPCLSILGLQGTGSKEVKTGRWAGQCRAAAT